MLSNSKSRVHALIYYHQMMREYCIDDIRTNDTAFKDTEINDVLNLYNVSDWKKAFQKAISYHEEKATYWGNYFQKIEGKCHWEDDIQYSIDIEKEAMQYGHVIGGEPKELILL